MNITVEQFNQLVTKDDLELRMQNVASRRQVNDLMTAVQGLAKRIDDFKTELAALYSTTRRHDRRFGKIGNILKIDYHDVDDVI